MKSNVNHYLLTLSLKTGHHLHGYLMCDDKRAVKETLNEMFDVAERNGLGPLPIVLSTTLSTGTDVVRTILRERFPETRHNLETAKRYHKTVWAMPASDPDDVRLMKLH
jgi:hypothetical protein